MQPKYFRHTSHFTTQNIKNTCFQGLWLNKISNFYLIKNNFKWNWHVLWNCECMVVKNTVRPPYRSASTYSTDCRRCIMCMDCGFLNPQMQNAYLEGNVLLGQWKHHVWHYAFTQNSDCTTRRVTPHTNQGLQCKRCHWGLHFTTDTQLWCGTLTWERLCIHGAGVVYEDSILSVQF